MSYRVLLITILTLFTVSGFAGEKRYRVEILVLTHLEHQAVPTDTEIIRDFSDALDFLKAEVEEEPPSDEGESESTGMEPEIGDEEAVDELTSAEAGQALLEEDQPEEPWADVIPVEDKGDAMREAWRRLRLSAPFRPEQYLSWEQSADEPFPTLRIHDLEVVLVDDPYADLRHPAAEDLEEDSEAVSGIVAISDQETFLPDSDDVDDATQTEEAPEFPDPTLYHRIDGTVMLRRSRFLHLDLDLELRQAVFDDQPLEPAAIASGESDSDEPIPPPPYVFPCS